MKPKAACHQAAGFVTPVERQGCGCQLGPLSSSRPQPSLKTKQSKRITKVYIAGSSQ